MLPWWKYLQGLRRFWGNMGVPRSQFPLADIKCDCADLDDAAGTRMVFERLMNFESSQQP